MALPRPATAMAAILQRPTLCAFLYPPATRVAAARAASTGVAAQRKQPSPSAAMKSQMAKVGMPNDVGLLPGLFIMPTGKDLPSLWHSPRLRARLEWYRFKTRFMDFVRIVYYRRAMPKPRPKPNLRQLPPLAQAMHHQMYTAFAEGDLQTLQQLCCDGLLRSFEGRLAVRPRRRRLRWRVARSLARPRLVAHVAAQTQAGAGTGVRQAVVRVRTRQALEAFDISIEGGATGNNNKGPGGGGEAPQGAARREVTDWNAVASGRPLEGKEPGEVREEDKDEYVVVQRIMRDGVEGEWRVWGTTQESDWRKALE